MKCIRPAAAFLLVVAGGESRDAPHRSQHVVRAGGVHSTLTRNGFLRARRVTFQGHRDVRMSEVVRAFVPRSRR
jgi:hypothetical protein